MAQISVSGFEVYTITTRQGESVFQVQLVIGNDDLSLDHDALAEAIRATIGGLVPSATASFNEKHASVDTVIFPT